MKTQHTAKVWFNKGTVYDLFQTDFISNTINKIKIQQSILRNWIPPNATPKQQLGIMETLSNNLANQAINMILSSPQGEILRYIEWMYLEDDTRYWLQQTVFEIIQNMVSNNQIIERLLGIGVSAPGFNMSQDTTSWLLTGDSLGINAKQLILKSGVRDYKLLPENMVWQRTPAGNIEIIKGDFNV